MTVFPLISMAIHPIRFGDEGEAATRGLLRRFDALEGEARLPAPALLPVEDADELAASLITDLAYLEDDDLIVGVALWAIRHDVALTVVEPVVNALALRSNRAAGRAEIAAVFGLMQGVTAHVAPRLRADLERSNPERPWRVAHVNLAITAIRTEDPAMIDYAFDALDAALPDERAGFYSEALALALAPRIAPAVRARIEARHLKWS